MANESETQEERRTGREDRTASEAGQPEDDRGGRSKTAGTNRDFDESRESKNQGHGHPRPPGS